MIVKKDTSKKDTSKKDDKKEVTEHDENIYPVLPLRDIVVFPRMVVPLFVGREKSINALEEVVKKEGQMMLLTQRDAGNDDPTSEDTYRIGVVANILQLLRLPDGTVKVLVEGLERAEVNFFLKNNNYLEANISIIKEEIGNEEEIVALSRSVIKNFGYYIKLNRKIPPEIMNSLSQIDDPTKLVDNVCSHLALKIQERQELLEIRKTSERMEKVFSFMEREVGVMNTETRIRSRVRNQMEKTQKEYYLNEQMKAIQKELYNEEEEKDEFTILSEKIESLKLTKEAKEKSKSELKKLSAMSPMSAEAAVVRNYLDWIIDIPWKKYSKTKLNIDAAQKILDEDHSGLEKVKERIIEHLAVQQRTKSLKGSILCLVGPPGVGKTSLAESIARATGRKFARISLGGVRDESEIRGHRKTYIGSMPGKIIQSMKKVKVSNPLILLDELDKMGHDFRGDPASALLEVLDPEQNDKFGDHYLEVDYDLSDVMFITTANTRNMPRPLLDRMEIIHISGYTEDEKVNIAKQHLIAKQMKEHGLKDSEWSISDSALHKVIQFYTRESGVRNLEREIAKLARKAVTEIAKSESKNKGSVKDKSKTKNKAIRITNNNLKKYLGVQKFDHNKIDKDDHIGVTTGLAYTEVGGDLLPIEAVLIPGGKGRAILTGKLGDVMQESAQAAWSYIRSRSYDFGIKKDKFLKNDIHIHVPEGATPKDGPSAGAAMCTTIVSLLTGTPVKKTIAMTGEISLRGMVMPIGGLKEKLLAALRGEIKTVLIPEKNIKDLEDMPKNIKDGLEIIPVSSVDEVLKYALASQLTPISWEDDIDNIAVEVTDVDNTELVKH